MSDDPIREALRAACEWMHHNCGEAESVEAWRYDAGGVIAAFLRALPDRFPMQSAHNPACQVWGHASGEMAKLAALVERAAGGGDE
jgi:hypothetical protein